MSGVAVVGVGMTKFGRHLDRSLGSLAAEAVGIALRDAGLEAADIDAVVFSNSFDGLLSGQESIRGEIALDGLGLAGKELVNVENACASGSSAIHIARSFVAAGTARRVLVVGAEKLFHEDRARSFAALRSATDVTAEVEGGEGRSVFMDHYARKARAHVAAHGTTLEEFATVAVKNSANGSRNPYAQHQAVHTVDAVIASRPVTDPLTLYMCSPISDGAAAIVLSADAGSDGDHPQLIGTAVATGDGVTDPTPIAAQRVYAMGGITPADVDFAEVHDATAPSEILAIEDLGLAARGGAAALMMAGETAVGGELPINPSGGLLARGHPIGATGVAQVVEAVWQLRGEADGRQVAGAEIGMTQNAGGVLRDDVAVAAVTLLRR